VLILLAQFIPALATAVGAEGSDGRLIILQTYGGGGPNQNATPVSHSFVEVYNPSDEAVDLNGWKIVYHDERVPAEPIDWEADLSDTSLMLESRASFLIRGQELTALVAPAYTIGEFDLSLPDYWLDNRAYSVKLIDPQGDVINEMAGTVPNKHTALRRVGFAADGAVEIDYRTAQGMTSERLEEVRPRSLADGQWGELGGTNAPVVDLKSPVLINQVYGRLTDGAVSHGFIELYNRSADPVDLGAYSLQYAENGDAWQKLDLSGTLPPYHSFLVRCLPGNNDGNHRYQIDKCDTDWSIDISNRCFKVALVGNQELLTVKEPTVDDGVLDLVGAYNSASDPWDWAAGIPVAGISKQKAARRVLFANTGNNSADFETPDYRVPPSGVSNEALTQIRPRWTGDGEWGIYNGNITGLQELWFAGSAEAAASYSDGRKATDMIGWQRIGGRYTLVVPQSADMSGLRIFYDAGGPVTVNGRSLVYGQATDAFAAGGNFTLSCGGRNYPITVIKTSAIPSMFISTESGNLNYVHADKANREPGRIMLIEADGKTVAYNGTLDRINGRGNATWTKPKKPYNIKLTRSVPLLGMMNYDKWSLLANHYDSAQIRNQISYDLANEVGIEFTSRMKPVDLYINNEYMGLYSLVERREVGGTVKITDLEKATERANNGADLSSFPRVGPNGFAFNTYKYFNIPNDPADITGGYLMEYDFGGRYSNELSGFVTSRGQAVTLATPEYATKRQIEYIRAFVQDMEDAIYSSNGYNAKGKHYSDYIDEVSFAKMYLVQEYTMNQDAAVGSFFLYKESDLIGDGKIHAAPVWDMDQTFANVDSKDYVNLRNPRAWFVNQGRMSDNGWTPHILAALCQHDRFVQTANAQWKTVFSPVVGKIFDPNYTAPTRILDSAGTYADTVRDSANINNTIWGFSNFDRDVASVINFAQRRADFMNADWKFPSPADGKPRTIFAWWQYIWKLIESFFKRLMPSWLSF